MVEQRRQGALDAIRAHEALQIAELAPRQGQQSAIWAVRVPVDRAIDEGQKVGLPLLEPPADDGGGLGRRKGASEVGRKPAEKPSGDPQVGGRSA